MPAGRTQHAFWGTPALTLLPVTGCPPETSGPRGGRARGTVCPVPSWPPSPLPPSLARPPGVPWSSRPQWPQRPTPGLRPPRGAPSAAPPSARPVSGEQGCLGPPGTPLSWLSCSSSRSLVRDTAATTCPPALSTSSGLSSRGPVCVAPGPWPVPAVGLRGCGPRAQRPATLPFSWADSFLVSGRAALQGGPLRFPTLAGHPGGGSVGAQGVVEMLPALYSERRAAGRCSVLGDVHAAVFGSTHSAPPGGLASADPKWVVGGGRWGRPRPHLVTEAPCPGSLGLGPTRACEGQPGLRPTGPAGQRPQRGGRGGGSAFPDGGPSQAHTGPARPWGVGLQLEPVRGKAPFSFRAAVRP